MAARTPQYSMVRVSARAHATLRELAIRRGQSMAQVVEEAVERERRAQLLREANAAWSAIMADPASRVEIDAERNAWDATLADGLEPEDWSADVEVKVADGVDAEAR
jgi:hypothetical protein